MCFRPSRRAAGILDGVIKVSASSLKLFRGCPRRWVFQKILGLREPESASTNLGTATHAEFEAWGKHGTLPQSKIAQRALAAFAEHPYWPDPKLVESEGSFSFHLQGVPFHGYTDMRRQGAHAKHRIVSDLKTTGNLAFALRAEGGLLVDVDGNADPQSVIYAAREYIEGAEEVTGIWLYVLSREPHTTNLVSVDFCPSAVEREMRKACDDGRKMLKLYDAKPEVNTVPYNSGYCWAFKKPCPHASACIRGQGGLFSPPDALDLLTNGEAMTDFLTSIKNSFPGVPAEPEDDAPPPPPEEDDAPPPPPEYHPAEVLAMGTDGKVERDLTAAVEAGFINPPEAAGKKPYANPAEAILGEGIQAPVEKPKKPRAKRTAVYMNQVVAADGTTLEQAIKEITSGAKAAADRAIIEDGERLMAKERQDQEAAGEVLHRIYKLLKSHFEG